MKIALPLMRKFLSIIVWFSTITLLVACPNANSVIIEWSLRLSMRIEFGSIFLWDLHGIIARSDCNCRVNDNTAAITGAYYCKKHEGMTDIKILIKTEFLNVQFNVTCKRQQSLTYLCSLLREVNGLICKDQTELH